MIQAVDFGDYWSDDDALGIWGYWDSEIVWHMKDLLHIFAFIRGVTRGIIDSS